MRHYHVAILGSSPNALALAARLAGAGRRVVVLEPRAEVGGAVATEEIAPGFRADTGVMSGALDPEIAGALGIGAAGRGDGGTPWVPPGALSPSSGGVEIAPIGRGTVTALDAPGGPRSFSGQVGSPPASLPRAIRDAVEVLRVVYKMNPVAMPVPSGDGAAALGELGARLVGLGGREMHEVLRLLFMSARDLFEETTADPVERGLLCGAAVRGMSEGPFAPGTVFGFLHHEAVRDGLFRSTTRGGLSAIAGALARRARALGAEIRTGQTGPLGVIVEYGLARGVRLPDGTRLAADVVVSDFDARTTFTELVRPVDLGPEDNRAIANGRYRGSVGRVHLALGGLPAFDGVTAEALRGTLVLGSDVVSLERAWDQAKRGALPDRPYIEAAIPSIADPGLAPAGKHVLSAWVQWVPRGGAGPAAGDLAQALREAVVGGLARFAPELPGLVEHVHVALPGDLGGRFRLTEGHLYGGEVNLAQAFFSRPVPGYSGYESPIGGLFLCGSAAHPGGYSGRSGWNLGGRLLENVTPAEAGS